MSKLPLGPLAGLARRWRDDLELLRLRRHVRTRRPGSTLRWKGFTLRISDGPNFYMLWKDIFVRRIYHFESVRPDPLILDCGSNIGVSILYFKRLYPRARILAFEPDPVVLPLLEENLSLNRTAGVDIHRVALSPREGTMAFHSDGRVGSYLAAPDHGPPPQGWRRWDVPCTRLRHHLADPVDFLKMNVEGAEWEVLADCEDRLRNVRELAIEYHHLPHLPRTLHLLLSLLHRHRFEYLVHDFDPQTNAGAHPPFHLRPESRYFLLVYARRLD